MTTATHSFAILIKTENGMEKFPSFETFGCYASLGEAEDAVLDYDERNAVAIIKIDVWGHCETVADQSAIDALFDKSDDNEYGNERDGSAFGVSQNWFI